MKESPERCIHDSSLIKRSLIFFFCFEKLFFDFRCFSVRFNHVNFKKQNDVGNICDGKRFIAIVSRDPGDVTKIHCFLREFFL